MATAALFLTLYALLNGLLVWQDLRYGLLPDRFTCPLLWCGLACASTLHVEVLPEKIWGAIAGYLGFAAIYWGHRLMRGFEGLGYGDVKFLAALGAWHGWQPLGLLVFIAASLACALTCLACLTSLREQVLKNPLPFGPFLAGAGLITGYQELFRDLLSSQL
ncbi:A24 family peptidase [Yokenella regensburgei]|uniref:prepilin peptidase n=1 Tax=Yokenella regensburgei TaxID=158877 RepID=UPI003F14BE5D